jgi:hypothetical protein
MKLKDYQDFRELIRQIAKDEIHKQLIKENIFVSCTGVITNITYEDNVNPYSQKCNVDIVFSVLTDILNKSGEILQVGDTVTILQKKGSNYSNAFIAYKHG